MAYELKEGKQVATICCNPTEEAEATKVEVDMDDFLNTEDSKLIEAMEQGVSWDHWFNTAFKVKAEITRVNEQTYCVQFTNIEGDKMAYLSFYKDLVDGALSYAVDMVMGDF